MSTAIAAALRPIPIPKPNVLRSDPAAQAFMLLRIAFTVAPILFGLDKFAEVMIDNWPKYLAPSSTTSSRAAPRMRCTSSAPSRSSPD